MNTRVSLIAAVLLVLLGLAVFFYFKSRTVPPYPALRPLPDLPPIAQQFMKILPADLSEEQRREVHNILARFYDVSTEGMVTAEDQVEIGRALETFLEHGSISRDELNAFMARISHYSYRSRPEFDPSGTHPLVEPDTSQ
jgi:hypothetical protein